MVPMATTKRPLMLPKLLMCWNGRILISWNKRSASHQNSCFISPKQPGGFQTIILKSFVLQTPGSMTLLHVTCRRYNLDMGYLEIVIRRGPQHGLLRSSQTSYFTVIGHMYSIYIYVLILNLQPPGCLEGTCD